MPRPDAVLSVRQVHRNAKPVALHECVARRHQPFGSLGEERLATLGFNRCQHQPLNLRDILKSLAKLGKAAARRLSCKGLNVTAHSLDHIHRREPVKLVIDPQEEMASDSPAPWAGKKSLGNGTGLTAFGVSWSLLGSKLHPPNHVGE